MKFQDARKRKVSPPPFPEDLILPMFLDGLRRGKPIASAAGVPPQALNGLYDLNGMLHELPMAFGALRASDGIHVFTSDVKYDFVDGTGADILLYDPESGAPGAPGFQDRKEYLSSRFGLQPRTQLIGQQHAGFKGLHLNEIDDEGYQFTRVHWVVPEIGHLYWHLYRAFVAHVRPVSARHPYLLTSLANRAYGTPWTLEAAGSRFERSLARLDLEQSSAEGLCMHAWRHGVKRFLDVRGVSQSIQQIVLHHKTIGAQGDYGQPTLSEVRVALDPFGRRERVGGGDGRATRLDEIGRELAAFFGVGIR